ncbi:protein pxr-1-like, partial [Contarinia nasturtii]|uniref:protein pxr-1-like n=1 Tax=Contarinia nasturtii TaxID=265458 RepID=UPI0012D3B22A
KNTENSFDEEIIPFKKSRPSIHRQTGKRTPKKSANCNNSDSDSDIATKSSFCHVSEITSEVEDSDTDLSNTYSSHRSDESRSDESESDDDDLSVHSLQEKVQDKKRQNKAAANVSSEKTVHKRKKKNPDDDSSVNETKRIKVHQGDKRKDHSSPVIHIDTSVRPSGKNSAKKVKNASKKKTTKKRSAPNVVDESFEGQQCFHPSK